jgi:carbon-monoxide dehydrogenase medium subunit
MAFWNHYHLPSSVDEALSLLMAYAGQARVVAGGTDLILELQQGRRPPVGALIDVTRIAEMTRIEESGGYLSVGAAVTHTAIVASPLLTQKATCLVESCGVIGGPQVRNVATLGGNVAHALPAGDGTLSLVALDAEAEIASNLQSPTSNFQASRAWRPVLSLFKGPGESTVDQTHELIVRFRFKPTGDGEATAYKRIMRPQGVALPILALAVWMQTSGDVVDDVRIALGPAGPVPLRATRAETYLTGIPLVKDVMPQIADLIVSEAKLRTSRHRATADYRRELIEVLARRALTLAYQRARTGEAAPEGVGLA